MLSIRHTKLVEIVTLKKGALFAKTSAIAGLSSLQCGTRNILSTNIAGMLNTGFKPRLSIPDFIFQHWKNIGTESLGLRVVESYMCPLSLPVFYAIFQLLQEIKVQSIQLSKVEEDLLSSILGEDGSACLLGCLDGTMNYLGDREGGERLESRFEGAANPEFI